MSSPKEEEGIPYLPMGTRLEFQCDISCLFAQTHANLPDSRASAKIIEFLDKYLGLKVDTKPLLMQAEIFENKLKGMMQQQEKTKTDSDRKQMSYLG